MLIQHVVGLAGMLVTGIAIGLWIAPRLRKSALAFLGDTTERLDRDERLRLLTQHSRFMLDLVQDRCADQWMVCVIISDGDTTGFCAKAGTDQKFVHELRRLAHRIECETEARPTSPT